MGMRCPPITTNGQTAGRIFQNKILSRSTNKYWDHSTWAPFDVAHASCCRNWSRTQYNDTTCTTAAVWAGATPGGFWAALSPKNGGRSRPIWCFFRGASCFPAFRISDSGKKLLAPQTEEGAEEEAEGYSFGLLQVSPPICLREPQPDRLLR